jgi:hypothetical protein
LILRGLWVRTLLTSRFDPTAAFLGGQPLLSGKHLGTSLSDPGVLRAVLGAAGFASPEAVRTLT